MMEISTDLGGLEREVMQLVWASGPLTADTVRERLPRRLKESTVRTVLKRLEDKGFVTHSVRGRTYVFAAAESRGEVAARAVRRIIDWMCNGSVEEVLVGMVDSAVLDSTRNFSAWRRKSQRRNNGGTDGGGAVGGSSANLRPDGRRLVRPQGAAPAQSAPSVGGLDARSCRLPVNANCVSARGGCLAASFAQRCWPRSHTSTAPRRPRYTAGDCASRDTHRRGQCGRRRRCESCGLAAGLRGAVRSVVARLAVARLGRLFRGLPAPCSSNWSLGL